jgi:hypothetical protein
MSKHLSRTVLSSLALAGLAGAFVSMAEPAAARQTQCQQKFTGCNDRCFGRHDDPMPCIQRTCYRQYDNCVAAEDKGGKGGGGKGGKGGKAGFGANTKPSGPVASGPFSPRPANPGLPTGGIKPKPDGGIGTGSVRPNGGGMRPFASGRR